jgi:hypothetical protein
MNMKQLIVLASLWLTALTGFAQLNQIPPRLSGNTAIQAGGNIEIRYIVNYPGFVQLYLYNDKKECVWIKGKTTETIMDTGGRQTGEGMFRISTRPMTAGERYTYVLKYKGKDYQGSFYVSQPAGGASPDEGE